MSLHIQRTTQGSIRPTRSGPRRRPRGRDLEVRRPSQVYRHAVYSSLMKMCVIERARAEGFRS